MIGVILISITILFLIGIFSFHKYFMRDPVIKISKNEKDIISPASGKIIKIINLKRKKEKIIINKGLFGKIKTLTKDISKNCYIISIFMSPLDIHIQRAALSGKVISVKHKKGRLLLTTKFENGLINEKVETIIKNEKIGKYKIIQIAGFIVKRIESWVKPGKILEKGEKIGRINYGSQVSIILPSDKVILSIKEGDKVRVGSSIIGKIK